MSLAEICPKSEYLCHRVEKEYIKIYPNFFPKHLENLADLENFPNFAVPIRSFVLRFGMMWYE